MIFVLDLIGLKIDLFNALFVFQTSNQVSIQKDASFIDRCDIQENCFYHSNVC